MALQLGIKINRYLYKNTFFDYTKAFSSKITKLKFQPAKAAAPLTQEQLEGKLTNQDVKQISSIPTTTIPTELENEPVIIRRKFAKSSTQIALTQPLKLSRLANPFPESVKTMPSDTVSDAEKARIMQEEVKMEARFHLQMQQEKLQQQNLNKQFENQNQNFNNNAQQSLQPESLKFQQMQEQSKQPTFRKPKKYYELLKEGQGEINQSEKCAVNTSEANAEDRKERRPRGTRCRRKSHTRAARYLRHSWYPRHVRRQQRQYSTAINPVILSDVEQCELILRRLKETHPQYRNLQKPVFIPGSKEEKQFIKNILKLNAKHTTNKRIKTKVPFPSYSEIKSYKYDYTLQNNKSTNEDPTNNIKFGPGNIPRFYSTKKIRGKVNLHISRKPCPKFKLKGMKPVECTPKKEIQRKQKAPYPSYSEVCDDPLQDEPAEYTYCPWKADISSLLKTKSHLKHFSTAAGDVTDVKVRKNGEKYPPPCKNPFPQGDPCDYEGQARKREEQKRKKHCPKKPKPYKNAKAASNIDSGKIISKIKTWLSSYKPDSENIKITRSADDCDGRETYIIDVCEYEEITPEQTRNKTDRKEEFQTEIVEIIQPLPDIHPIRNPFTRVGKRNMPFKNIEYTPIDILDSHASEMIQPIPVLTKNIPEFVSHSVSNLTPKTKPEELKLIPAKQNPVKTIPVNKISAETITSKIIPAKTIAPKIIEAKTVAGKPVVAKTVTSKTMAAKTIQAKTVGAKTVAAKTVAAKPVAAKPVASKPVAAKPVAAKPVAVKPVAAKPVAAKPVAAKPVAAKTVAAKTEAAKKNAAKPIPALICPGKTITKSEPKLRETKAKVETKPKEILINKVKEIFFVKKSNENINVNAVKNNLQFKPKNLDLNKVDKSNPVKKEEPKSKSINENKFTTKDFKLLNIKDNIFNPYKDFKVNEMMENRRNPLSKPIFTKEKCYKEPGCSDGLDGGCKKEKEAPPNKKCRLPKKKKLPSCNDTQYKKTHKFMPMAIPGLEDKPEYFINAPKKTYFKKSDNISNFINLHKEDIEVLANQNQPKMDDYEPFKLKPQFWKKSSI